MTRVPRARRVQPSPKNWGNGGHGTMVCVSTGRGNWRAMNSRWPNLDWTGAGQSRSFSLFSLSPAVHFDCPSMKTSTLTHPWNWPILREELIPGPATISAAHEHCHRAESGAVLPRCGGPRAGCLGRIGAGNWAAKKRVAAIVGGSVAQAKRKNPRCQRTGY